MKRSIFLLAFLVLAAGIAGAQSASRVTEILEEKQVTIGELAYMAGSELNLIKEGASYDASLQAAVDTGILKTGHNASDPATYAELAFICSKTWKVEKSLFFKLTNSPRYAFKQLQSLGVISSNADPSQIISGRTALNVISACIEKFGAVGGEE